MRRLFAFILTLAGILLLITTPSRAQASPQTFTPTRFTVVAEGAAKGPAVLLLPGLSSSRKIFDAEARILAPTYRLYRVQIDGFAGQPAGPNASGVILPAIVAELHQYIVANHLHPAVIGHSLGGLLGTMLADAHPEDVAKLMIVDALPFYGLVFSPQATVDIVRPQAQAMRDGMLKQTPEEAATGAAQTAAILVNDPAGRKIVLANSTASDRAVFAAAMYEDLTTDLRPGLASIKTPTVVLYPYDPAFQGPDPAPIENLYKSAYSAMPDITLHRIDNSRHFIQFDQPIAFNKEVQAFLK